MHHDRPAMFPSRASAAVRRRLTAGIAIAVMLAVALAPAWLMRTGMAAVPAAGWSEVCTAEGVLNVAADAGDTDGAPRQPGADRSHCPLCLPHGGLAFILPPSSWWMFRPLVAGRTNHRAVPAPHIRQATWPAFQSRGPPMLS